MMNAKISTGLQDEQDASPAFFQPLENVNAPTRPGFQGLENVDAVSSPRLPLRFFLDTKSTFGIPQVQTLEEPAGKISKGWKIVRLNFLNNRCEVFAA